MNKILALLLLFVSSAAAGAPNEVRLMQQNASDTFLVGRSLTVPAAGADGLFRFNGATALPDYIGVGSGLAVSGGILVLAPGGTASQCVLGNGAVGSCLSISINNAPGRSLVTSTAATGYQISATRNADACYEGTFSTTSTIGGPSAVSVFLETADTNSTTPGDWTTIAVQNTSNTITLAIVLNQVMVGPWVMCRKIPAAKFVRIRSGSITGTASAAINTTQQETLL